MVALPYTVIATAPSRADGVQQGKICTGVWLGKDRWHGGNDAFAGYGWTNRMDTRVLELTGGKQSIGRRFALETVQKHGDLGILPHVLHFDVILADEQQHAIRGTKRVEHEGGLRSIGKRRGVRAQCAQLAVFKKEIHACSPWRP